ncbi:MAG: pimeloyl-ACP methyl ester carboxylesterase [Myxococcota bacterium]
MIVFLHGLESTVDADRLPIGRKVQWLRPRYPTFAAPGLDTRAAIALRDHCLATRTGWFSDPVRLAAAFDRPMAHARAAITAETTLVIGSSFGGAVLLKLLHEGGWSGPSIFLAGAGLKLTPHRTLPPATRALFIHGRHDDVVPLSDSRDLAAAAQVPLWEVEDGHSLATILEDGTLGAAIGWLR